MIQIFIVDDHDMFSDGLAGLLSSQEDFAITGTASSIAQAKIMIAGTTPDVLILDVNLLDGEGYDFHKWLLDDPKNPSPIVIYVTGDDRVFSINKAMNLGATGYLDKTGGWKEVASAIRRGLDGKKTIGANIATKLAEYTYSPNSASEQLTFREVEILTGISKGRTAKEMSADMELALPTIRTYVSRLYRKLGAKDRGHAVSLGIAKGFIGSDN